MNELPPLKHLCKWVFPGFPLWYPLRAALRLLALPLWTLWCWLMNLVLAPLGLVSPRDLRNSRKRLSRLWCRGMLAIMGTRVAARGDLPPQPFFLVTNHITGMEAFAINAIFDMTCPIAMYIKGQPVLGRLIAGLDPLWVSQKKSETVDLNARIIGELRNGQSIVIAPEGDISPGRFVRRFRAGMLEPAAMIGFPVHYASVTYTTPPGWPPASKAVVYGPDAERAKMVGGLSDEEKALWGDRGPFYRYFLGLLALPWHDLVVRFAPDPIVAEDKFALANELHDAVEAILVPVE